MRSFLFAALLLIVSSSTAQPTDPKSLGRINFGQVSSAGLAPSDFDPAQSAGLFVGVNDFTDNSIVDLRFAADDAVDTAWFFVTSGLIPPERVWICLAGQPTKASSLAHRDALKAAGANILGANYDDVYDALFEAKSAALAKGLLVLQFSSHGTSADPDAMATSDDLYLFMANTRKFDPRNRTIDLGTIRRDLGTEGRAERTLILLDACREKYDAGQKSGDASSKLSARVSEMMKDVRGTVTIFATKDRGFSFDGGIDPLTRQPIENGIFIHYFLNELATKRSADPATGAVRVEDIVRGVNNSVANWVRGNPEATASFRAAGAEPGITYLPSGPEIMQLPLTVDLDRNRAVAEEKERLEREAKEAATTLAERIRKGRTTLALAAANDDSIMAIMPQVTTALNTWTGSRQAELLAALEALDADNEASRFLFAEKRWKELGGLPTSIHIDTPVAAPSTKEDDSRLPFIALDIRHGEERFHAALAESAARGDLTGRFINAVRPLSGERYGVEAELIRNQLEASVPDMLPLVRNGDANALYCAHLAYEYAIGVSPNHALATTFFHHAMQAAIATLPERWVTADFESVYLNDVIRERVPVGEFPPLNEAVVQFDRDVQLLKTAPSINEKVENIKTDMLMMAAALETYNIDNNRYAPMAKSLSESVYARQSIAYQFIHGSIPQLTDALTTPIPYIQKLPAEPFLRVFSPSTFAYWTDEKERWIIWSPGPDYTYDITAPGKMLEAEPNGTPAEVFVNHTYDPTNGTISAGDIWRFKK